MELVLASKMIKSWKLFVVKLIDFGSIRDLKSHKTLMLAFTSETGQSVAHTRHRKFNLDFSVREMTYLGILQPQFQPPDLKSTRDRTKQIEIFALRHRFFSSNQPAPVLENTALRCYTSRLKQKAQYISCRVYKYPF